MDGDAFVGCVSDASDEEDSLAHVPHSRIAPTFLHSNAQAHRDVLFAWADLFDNSRDSDAQRLSIDVRGRDTIVVTDDACGMSEKSGGYLMLFGVVRSAILAYLIVLGASIFLLVSTRFSDLASFIFLQICAGFLS